MLEADLAEQFHEAMVKLRAAKLETTSIGRASHVCGQSASAQSASYLVWPHGH